MSERPWPGGAATGVGSMPGTDVREATRVVLGELPDLPHLPELPARGVGADLTGRAVGLLVDLHAEVQPSGWRVADAAGRDERRAVALLAEDLDALEELAEGWTGLLKLQVAGPWTVASTLELRYGDKALADVGACRDLAPSLAEGLAEHVRQVARRLPGAQLVVQLDEPTLTGVLEGSVPTASGFGRLGAVEPERVVAGLRTVLDALPDDVVRVVHCCARDVPVELITRAGAHGVSLDLALLGRAGEEAVGAAVEAGTRLFLGVLDPLGRSTAAPGPGGRAGQEPSDVAATVAPVRSLWHRLGFPADTVPEVVLTPACGLAAASPDSARAALALLREAGHRLAEDPDDDLRRRA